MFKLNVILDTICFQELCSCLWHVASLEYKFTSRRTKISQLKTTLIESLGCQFLKSTNLCRFHNTQLFGRVAQMMYFQRETYQMWFLNLTKHHWNYSWCCMLQSQVWVKSWGYQPVFLGGKGVSIQGKVLDARCEIWWSLMHWDCVVAGGSGALVKIDGIMNFAEVDSPVQNLVASIRRFRLGCLWIFQI